MVKKFKSDGCSFYPDQNLSSCCKAHDKVYWKGGTKQQRKVADKKLEKCVEKKGHKVQDMLLSTMWKFWQLTVLLQDWYHQLHNLQGLGISGFWSLSL